jgi:hypothetical protein
VVAAALALRTAGTIAHHCGYRSCIYNTSSQLKNDTMERFVKSALNPKGRLVAALQLETDGELLLPEKSDDEMPHGSVLNSEGGK